MDNKTGKMALLNDANKGGWVLTHSGQRVDLYRPKPEQIRIEDIAHHLARTNRWCGAADMPINVAAHSASVALVLDSWGMPPHMVLMGLLHDAHEAYMGDIPTPVKNLLRLAEKLDCGCSHLDHLANGLDAAIFEATGLLGYFKRDARAGKAEELRDICEKAVHMADEMIGQGERDGHLPEHADWPIKRKNNPMPKHSIEDSEKLFLNLFNSLTERLGSYGPEVAGRDAAEFLVRKIIADAVKSAEEEFGAKFAEAPEETPEDKPEETPEEKKEAVE
jgi:hypothetical protein